jgi:hypothetical protein
MMMLSLRVHKLQEISLLYEDLLASQGGLISVELHSHSPTEGH